MRETRTKKAKRQNRKAKMTDIDYLTPKELVERWRNSVNIRTLANWRSSGQGPKFVKIGGRVVYRARHVEEYEQKNTRGRL